MSSLASVEADPGQIEHAQDAVVLSFSRTVYEIDRPDIRSDRAREALTYLATHSHRAGIAELWHGHDGTHVRIEVEPRIGDEGISALHGLGYQLTELHQPKQMH